MSERDRLLIIDDDVHQTRHIASALKLRGFDPTCVGSEAAFRRVIGEEGRDPFDLCLIDVMIPTDLWPRFSEEETHGGLMTGFLIAADIRDMWPKVPLVIWSGTPFRWIREQAAAISQAIPDCTYLPKHEAIEEIRRIFDRFKTTGKIDAGSLERIWDRIRLEPGFHGISFDLKGYIDSHRKR